jgi:serine/threonine-protein kinase HipA
MAKNNLIELYCFGTEIGRIGLDENRNASFFQYNPEFLANGRYINMFPLLIKRIQQVQVFDRYNNETFRGLPPMIADSLPDMFGNIIFKTWMERNNKDFEQITVLEQLAYVGQRGVGALEYLPTKDIPVNATINIDDIVEVVKQVMDSKNETAGHGLDHSSLLNVFKIGSSAGGARPKILVSEEISTGRIIPGDLIYSSDYRHYLIKLDIEEDDTFNREVLEYAYYLTATELGINMMPSSLIDGKHFSTLRFDRKDGRKKHVLTATGLTGMDFKDPKASSYENLFSLAIHLKVPHRDIEQLFRRMVFNVVFGNHDDHLKNHAFIYNDDDDKWELAPAYDVTYSLNPLLNYKKTSRALSINGKRIDLHIDDLLSVAGNFTIKNAAGIVRETYEGIDRWLKHVRDLKIRESVIESIRRNFMVIK